MKASVNGAEDEEVTYSVNGQVFSSGEFKVEGVKPWSPESPNLYDLTVTVRKGAWRDSVSRKIGFRTAEFRADGFYLNDKGLVSRDRMAKKDAYWFYKANWNPEPMLHLSGKRLVNANAEKGHGARILERRRRDARPERKGIRNSHAGCGPNCHLA